jgi:hypothetical protein
MSAYLSRVISSHEYRKFRHIGKQLSTYFPKRLQAVAERAEEYARGLATGGTLFEELGFFYVGPLDGHNLDHLVPVLENVRDEADHGPVLIHVVTQKGKGYAPAEASADKYHGVNKFDVGHRHAAEGEGWRPLLHRRVRRRRCWSRPSSTTGSSAITAAMPAGTGLDRFAEAFPERFFDVGHRRAARGDLRGGAGERGLPAVRGDLLDLPPARRSTRSSTTSRSRTCRSASRWTGRASWAPTGDPRRLVRHRLPRLPAEHGPDGAADEAELARMAVLVVDDTALPKMGKHSVGVARQYCGAVGKRANCQVLVSLTMARDEVPLPVRLRLFLPDS